MKFLLDTNILIPLEPAGEADLERQTGPAADFVRMVAEAGFQVFIHPEAFTDISRDADENRRSVRKILLGKYPSLRDAPPIPDVLTLEVGSAQIDSNDWVDNALIAAVYSDAVDYLVTEDNGIIRKARRVGLQDRIVTLSDAAMILDGLIDSTPPPPPAVQDVKAHSLRESDPIFIGLREDYPGFDAWLRKCKLEHRQAWTIV
jgi:hypothetical protein